MGSFGFLPPPAMPQPFVVGQSESIGSLEGSGIFQIPGTLIVGLNNQSTLFDGTVSVQG